MESILYIYLHFPNANLVRSMRLILSCLHLSVFQEWAIAVHRCHSLCLLARALALDAAASDPLLQVLQRVDKEG